EAGRLQLVLREQILLLGDRADVDPRRIARQVAEKAGRHALAFMDIDRNVDDLRIDRLRARGRDRRLGRAEVEAVGEANTGHPADSHFAGDDAFFRHAARPVGLGNENRPLRDADSIADLDDAEGIIGVGVLALPDETRWRLRRGGGALTRLQSEILFDHLQDVVRLLAELSPALDDVDDLLEEPRGLRIDWTDLRLRPQHERGRERSPDLGVGAQILRELVDEAALDCI